MICKIILVHLLPKFYTEKLLLNTYLGITYYNNVEMNVARTDVHTKKKALKRLSTLWNLKLIYLEV